MALVTLLHLPNEERARTVFIWEHDHFHRRFKPAFLLDPMLNEDIAASKWHQDHQQSQNIMTKGGGLMLMDTDLSNPGQRAWWEFANHWEHYLSG